MDLSLFRALNELAGHSAVLDAFGVFAAAWLIFIELALIGGFWFLHRSLRTVAVVNALATAAVAWVVNQAIGAVYFRLRPFAELSNVHLLISKSADEKSFPSDHAAAAFALAFAVFLVNRRWGTVLLVIAAVISIGRVFVGVHYPTDVLAGAGVGIVSALLVHRVTHILLRTRHTPGKSV